MESLRAVQPRHVILAALLLSGVLIALATPVEAAAPTIARLRQAVGAAAPPPLGGNRTTLMRGGPIARRLV